MFIETETHNLIKDPGETLVMAHHILLIHLLLLTASHSSAPQLVLPFCLWLSSWPSNQGVDAMD